MEMTFSSSSRRIHQSIVSFECRFLALFANSPRCNGASAAEDRPAVIGVAA
jgi:hypothetical protein